MFGILSKTNICFNIRLLSIVTIHTANSISPCSAMVPCQKKNEWGATYLIGLMCAIEKNINKYELTCVLCECWREIQHPPFSLEHDGKNWKCTKYTTGNEIQHTTWLAIKLLRIALKLSRTDNKTLWSSS